MYAFSQIVFFGSHDALLETLMGIENRIFRGANTCVTRLSRSLLASHKSHLVLYLRPALAS